MTPTLHARLFGSPKLSIDDHPVDGFPSGKVVALGYYLLATGRAHSRTTLATLIWPDYDDAGAKRNLRGALYHLRNQLDAYLDVTRSQAGVHPHAPVTVDSLRFAHLLQDAARLPEDDPQRLDLLQEAVSLYRGPFLEGIQVADAEPFEEWQRGEQERFRRLAVQATHDLVDLHQAQGDLLAGMEAANRLLAIDSLHEDTHRKLMQMLAQDGQTGAALDHFASLQERLTAELDVDPDPQTTALAEQIRSGQLAAAVAAQPVAAPPRRRHNLPAPATAFLDREEAQAQILTKLADPAHRLVTITGVGGMGKSRLAAHVGLQLTALQGEERLTPQQKALLEATGDGVFFVRLAGIDGGAGARDHMAMAVANALQLEMAGAAPPLEQLLRVLAGRRLLLILDNFEHLQEHASFAADLLAHLAQVQVLVTSRTRLNLRGEQVVALDGLPLPEQSDPALLQSHAATRLFLNTAAAAAPGLAVDAENAPAIIEACSLLQGMPLGIELAASWTRVLSPAEIVHEIQRSLDFVQAAMPDLPPRHRSLRAVFDQSWRLLSPDARDALARLAIFRGSFSRAAAEQVAGAGMRLLGELMDQSMVKRRLSTAEHEGADAGATSLAPRFRVPEVLREFALDHLAESDAHAAVAQRHAAFYTDLLARRLGALQGNRQLHAVEELLVDLENIRTALTRTMDHCSDDPEACREQLGKAMEPLFVLLDIRGDFQEGERLFSRALAAVQGESQDGAGPAETSSEQARLVAGLRARRGWFLFHLGDHGRGEDDLRSALAVLEKTGPGREEIFVRNYLGALLRHTGRYPAAEETLQRAHALAEAAGDRYGASIALNTLGQVALQQGRVDRSLSFCRRALELKEQLGDRRGMIYSHTYLGRAALHQADEPLARAHFVAALEIAEELQDPRGVAMARQNLGDVAASLGHLAGAQRLYRQSLEDYRQIGALLDTGMVLVRLGDLSIQDGDPDQAAAFLAEAHHLAGLLNAAPLSAQLHLAGAALALSVDRPQAARVILDRLPAGQDLPQHRQTQLAALRARVEDVATPSPAPLSGATATLLGRLQVDTEVGKEDGTPRQP